jgi:ankyrin repeat protein
MDTPLYLRAVQALDSGAVPQLAALLSADPSLVSARWHVGEWYDGGYFGGAMLLHHVAGNPIRRPIPPNIVEVAALLLDRGADPNAQTEAGCTTIGLLLTSKQASEALVALPLIDLLHARGATDSLDDAETLTLPLLDAAPETAALLAERGAKMDVRHAAGLGRADDLKRLIAAGRPSDLLEEALMFACFRGRQESAEILLEAGARGDVLVGPGGRTPRTALHEAANRGHESLVRLIVEHGARTTVIEPNWNGTPAGWARHGGHTRIAEYLERSTK